MLTHEILMPRLSDTMTEGTIGRWLKRAGERVAKGEPLAEIETDKVTLELEAVSDGVLHEVLADVGATVPIGTVIAVLASGAEAGAPSAGLPAVTEDAPLAQAAENGAAASGAVADRPAPVAQPLAGIRATPLARALANGAGIDLRALASGSGPDGRIVKADVEQALAQGGGAVVPPALPAAVSEGDAHRAPSRLQVTIARRMMESKRTIPHFYLDAEIDMEEALSLREELKALDPPVEVSVTDLVVRACALALRDVPEVNASWVENELVFHDRVDIGIAVALDDGGLLVPVLRDADRKRLAELAAESKALASRCRSGAITPHEIERSTFSVSSLGMLGVRSFHAIINPPESGILAIGSLEEKVVPVEDGFGARARMIISLSADHRVYSGATGAQFLQSVKTRLEQPLALMAHIGAGVGRSVA